MIESGQRINDRYRILEKIGEGGMAAVYLAEDENLSRQVALKMIRTGSIPPDQLEKVLERFRREAKNLAKLSDVPGVVTLHDFGLHMGNPYLVMTYLPGGTLKEKIGQPIAAQQVVHWLLPIAEALSIVHSMDIIHRDIKPTNLLFDRFGRLALADFGIAKAFETSEYTLTATGLGVGTAAYMAPEQWRGDSSKQSDIYSLGVVMYELITGRKPYDGATISDIFLKVMTEPLPKVVQYAPGVHTMVERMLEKAMARRPNDRFVSMNDMITAMQSAFAPIAVRSTEAVIQEQPLTQMKAERGNAAIQTETDETVDQLDGRPPMPMKKPAIAPKRPETANEPWVIHLPGGVPMAFVRVPAGKFLMGSNAGDKDEQPEHEVYLDEFFIGKYPVTNEQYACYLRESGKNSRKLEQLEQFEKKGKANHPVKDINWHDTMKFCAWLSGYSGKTISLPTEAQWEKAARGVDGRMYPWGNEKPTSGLCNFMGEKGGTTPVGSYPRGASPYGALDMAGNVWEWVLDWYDEDYYSSSADENPQGPASGNYRVLRGGSWFVNVDLVRASNRYGGYPYVNWYYNGFRCFVSP